MTDLTSLRGVHDLGGIIDAPFEAQEHEYEPWEKRVHALRELLAVKGLMTVDELRRCVEGLGAEKYRALSYYEQWTVAMCQVMLERGVITDHELGSRIEQIRVRVT